MSDTNFKIELLKQDSRSAVDEQVTLLREIISAEKKRMKRLTFWAIGVWAFWFLMISTSLVVPMISKASGPAHPATQPAMTAPAHAESHSVAAGIFMGAIAIVCFGLLLGLPAVGIVLVIMLIVGRSTASRNQVRGSLAAIDAQLRMLGAPGVPKG